MFKKVILNTGAQVIGKAFTATSTLIVTILIGKSLGPAGYGEFTKIFVFVGYFYTLVDFGLNSIVVKISDSKNQIHLLKNLVAIRLILSFIFVSAAILIAFLLPYNPHASLGFSPSVKIGILIASLTIFTHALFTSANAYFQKNLIYRLSSIAAGVSAIVVLIAALVVAAKPNLFGFVFAYVLGGIALVVVAFYLIFKRSQMIIIPSLDIKSAKKILLQAWPVGLSLVFNLIYFRIDVFVLANFRQSTEVGLYGLAYQIFEASLALPIFFANGIYPFLIGANKEGDNKPSEIIKFWSAILFLVSLLLTFFLFSLSFFIPLVDRRFTGSTPALQILALGMPFFFLSAVLWNALIASGKQKILLLIYFFGAILNLTLNLIYAPRFGYIASSIITVVSEAIILLLLFLALGIISKKQNVT